MKGLQQLFYLHGVGYDYIKYTGEHVVFDQHTREAALQACGIDTDDERIIEKLNYELDVEQWRLVVPEVSLVEEPDNILKLKLPLIHRQVNGVISIPKLGFHFNFNTDVLNQSGQYLYQCEEYIELELPISPLPVGYHDAIVSLPFGVFNTQIWYVPRQCFSMGSRKQTGISVQLYTLNSDRNLGIGDFSDLEELIIASADAGCDFILLNPLHLLFSDDPERASPYSPNHRGLINPLYISIDNCEWVRDDENFKSALHLAHETLRQQKRQRYIDYTKVHQVKCELLNHTYVLFQTLATKNLLEEFEQFQVDFRVVLNSLNEDRFAIFCQWLAFKQLSECQQLSTERGMKVGLINDLAVGCARDSLEFLNNNQLYSTNAQVGAPPDPWAESGQDWGLPALDPIKIKQNKFHFFRTLVKSNLNNVGGLRIDHVMALRRLWWCLNLEQKKTGCYVYYPFEHLLAVLKIESNLSKSIVIGEDLGVVPPEVVSSMEQANLLGNILFYFEKECDGNFVNSHYLRENTILMIANHDVPPFKGWWLGEDINLKLTYHLINEDELIQEKEKRRVEQQRLIHWLNNHGVHDIDLHSDALDVYQLILKVLATSPSKLLCIQLDDLAQQTHPVNIPGTDKEYPNWRRRLSHSVTDIFSEHSQFIKNLTDIRMEHE